MRTIRNLFWLVLILAMGTPSAFSQSDSQPVEGEPFLEARPYASPRFQFHESPYSGVHIVFEGARYVSNTVQITNYWAPIRPYYGTNAVETVANGEATSFGYDEDGERIPLLKAARFWNGREYWYEDPFSTDGRGGHRLEDGEPIWYTRGKIENAYSSDMSSGGYHIKKKHSFTVETPSSYWGPAVYQELGGQSVYVDRSRSISGLVRLDPGEYFFFSSDLSLAPVLTSPYFGDYLDYNMEVPAYRAGGTNIVSYNLNYFEKTREEVFMHFHVELKNGPHHEDITLDYATQDNTAQAGEDYTATSGTLTFPAGTTNLMRTISIPILDDEVDEPEGEIFRLILSNPTNARLKERTSYSFGEFVDTMTIAIRIVEGTIEEPAPPVNVNNGGGGVNGGGATPIIVPHLSQNGASTSSSLMIQPVCL